MKRINIAKDFSRYPSGRFKINGSTSGEEFREVFLEPEIQQGHSIVVELDGTIGYGSSFLEEAFGGLVRKLRIPGVNLLKLITLESQDKSLISEIEDYIKQA